MAKKGKSKVDKKERQLAKLADLKYEYELLVNELFHLKEFISLVEFKPERRNEHSESYERFIKDNRLNLDRLENDGEDKELENEDGGEEKIFDGVAIANHTEESPRVRRRHTRGGAPAALDKDQNNVTEGDKWLSDIEPYVTKNFALLAADLEYRRQAHTTHETQQKKHTPSRSSSINKEKMAKDGTGEIIDIKAEPVKIKSSISNHKSQTKKSNSTKFQKSSTPIDESPESFTLLESGNYEDAEEYDDFYFTTSSEEELERPMTKRRRMNSGIPLLKLYVNEPKQTVTNSGHVVVPEHKSFHDYLTSFRSMDEDVTIEDYQNYINEQRIVVENIKKGLESGALKFDEVQQTIVPITTKEAQLSETYRPHPISFLYKEQQLTVHQDHLINQGIHMSRLFQSNKRLRIARARRVSQMIEQHFRHVAGAEERKQREEEKHKKFLARVAIQAVKKRWTMAEKAYRVLKKDEEEELQRIKGKEHLSKVLEQSSQLLGAQLNQLVSEGEATSDNEGSISSARSSHELLTSSQTSLLSEDDDFITSSEDEDIDQPKIEIIDEKQTSDEALTVEELQEKYQSLHEDSDSPNYNRKNDISTTNDDDDDDEMANDRKQNQSDEFSLNTLTTNLSHSNHVSELNSLLQNDISDDADEFDENSSSESQDFDDSEDMNLSDSDVSSDGDETMTDANSPEIIQKHDVKVETIKKSSDDEAVKQEFKPEDTDPISVVEVPIPSLLRGTLRIYQKQGLNWLASLYNNNTNGILADEMGLGKTIQTISLLSYLACEKENWGPHLIVVPTSVLLNWEMEFKKFAPGFKVLSYYGSPQQRKEKRKGWNKTDAFHVCIVSYQLVVQDQHSFKRKKWQYMILDEAHNIKNFRSTRWQALLNFNTRRRLLLTGTPLQNNIAELWSLLYFLMPKTIVEGKGISGFADLEAFQQWFGRPVDKLIEAGNSIEQDVETKETVDKLHKVLRPYLLRRLKADVEKQMPAKYEHIVYCRLSKRQRFLYDDFMSRAQTKATLASGNFMSIVNCLMQLRKVCNHPDLFEVRPVMSSLSIGHSVAYNFTNNNRFITRLLNKKDYSSLINMSEMNMVFTNNETSMTTYHCQQRNSLKCVDNFVQEVQKLRKKAEEEEEDKENKLPENLKLVSKYFTDLSSQKLNNAINYIHSLEKMNNLRCSRKPVYGSNLVKLLNLSQHAPAPDTITSYYEDSIVPLQTKLITNKQIIDKYAVVTPSVVTLDSRKMAVGLDDESVIDVNVKSNIMETFFQMENPLHHLQTKLTIAFPDKSLLQYDCGKLQKLASLLQNLKDNGHRALIFTQMTKVLDILEQFLNYHGYLYMRLDGATKIEDRQILTERFNNDPRVTVFILSSRSGGLGINLTGADTVIFYDSDWNPAMDKQCQDRCHRIGQTRDVHIYRFVSEHTIESNILKKANQKRELDNLVIQKGDFTTDYFTKLSVKDLLGAEATAGITSDDKPLLQSEADATKDPRSLEKLLAQAEDEDDVKAANVAMQEVEVDNEDFQDDPTAADGNKDGSKPYDEYEGTKHIEEYMLRFIANGYYF